MATKDITPRQYATWYGCSLSNVTKQIRKKRPLPHVITIKQWSRFYTLEVPESLNSKSFSSIKQVEKQTNRGRKPKIAT